MKKITKNVLYSWLFIFLGIWIGLIEGIMIVSIHNACILWGAICFVIGMATMGLIIGAIEVWWRNKQ